MGRTGGHDMASGLTYQRLKKHGYLTKSEIADRMPHLEGWVREDLINRLPSPCCVCNGVSLYSPEQVNAIMSDKHGRKATFNEAARDFITGKLSVPYSVSAAGGGDLCD